MQIHDGFEPLRADAKTAVIPMALLCALLLAQSALAVPSGVPKDPPAPPTGLGRLFGQEARLALDNCAITAQTASTAVVGFDSTYPYRFRRFQRSDSTWTSWTALPTGATSWDCQGTCFHDTARVEIRGCENSTCNTGAKSECAIPIGVPHNGPPELDWSGIETTSAGVLGCVQSDHTEIVVRLRYAGTHPLSGYPQIGGQPASERVTDRRDAGSVRNRVYAAPAGWTPADIAGGSWTTTVSLDSSGSRDVSLVVELSESCLSSPQAAIVGSGGTLAPIASGQLFVGGSELEISSGNPSSIYALTSHQLNHDGAPEPFGRITPATGLSDTAHTWTETATGRDGLTYTSPDLDLTAQAIACESDSALVTWWMDNSDNINLPASTDWVPGPTIRTNACPGVSPPPAPSGNRSVSDARVGTGSVATGWPTEVRALNATGQITELYFWYAGGWDNSGSDWYFYAKRNLSCLAGERVVSGSCQTCPTYDDCSGGTLTTQTWCNAGNPPADDRRISYRSCVGGSTVTLNACVNASDPDPTDQPCVVVCGPGERDGGGFCEPCPTYRTCDASGNLATQTHCAAGSPPGDAQIVNHQACQSGSTVTLQACVASGGNPPANNPCSTTCSSSERLVSGVCQPCPTYQACDSNGDYVTQTFCSPGTPPRNAQRRWNIECVNGDSDNVLHCIGEGGLASDPGDVPCSGETCIYYDGCDQPSGWGRNAVIQSYYRCASNPVARPTPQVFTRRICEGRGQPWEYTATRYHCVGEDGFPSVADVPDDDVCDGWCENYFTCPDLYLTGANPNLFTSLHCGNGVPEDAYSVARTRCVNGSTGTFSVCIGEGGHTSDPGNNPCVTCASNEREVNGRCETCPTYYVCNGNSRVRERWCQAGSPPSDAQTDSFQSCVGGRTVTTNTCVPPGGNTPANDPCEPTQGIETYCDSNGNAQTRPSGSSQNVNSLDEASDCTSGETLNGNSCCVGCTQTARPSCTSGRSYTWEASQCRWIRSTVSRPSCGGLTATWDSGSCSWDCPNLGTETYCDSNGVAQERPASGSSDVDNLDSSSDCTSSEELNSDSCCVTRSTQTYLACSNGVVTPETWTGSGSPVDDDTATRTYCVGASKRTATICGSSNQDDQPTTAECQNQGKVRNSAGCCAAVLTYEACSNGVVTPEPWTGSGNPVNDDTATHFYCVGAVKHADLICASVDDDDLPTSCSSGYSLNSSGCCAQDTEPLTYEACSNGVVTPEPWTGSGNPVNDDTATHFYCVGAVKHADLICASVDDDDLPTSCSSGYSLNSSGCCAEIPTYEACSNGVVTTKPWTGNGNPVNDPTATRYFCIGATADEELICASRDRNDKPRSCGAGYSLNGNRCCELDPPPPPPQTATETYCDSRGNAQTRTISGTQDLDSLDSAADCTSRQALNSQSCCQPLGNESYCDSNGNAQTQLASGFQDVDNLDSSSDCASDEELNSQSCCVEKTGPCEPSGTKPCEEGYTHSWSTTSCSYRRSTSKIPKPACQEPQSEATWSCSDEEWQHGTVTAPACREVNGLGRVYDRWQLASCNYGYSTASPPTNCSGRLEWDISNCEWDCAILDLQFSFPALISEQTSQATYEQSLDVSFNSDGSITLTEILTGPGITGADGTTVTSLGSWATGSEVARASEVVEYRLAGTDWGSCYGPTAWTAFSGLALSVMGEAHVGQVAVSCRYEFRYAETGVAIGNSRIQLSTRAGSGPPGTPTQ